MAVEKIQYTDTLRQGADKINAAIDQSNEAIEKATTADANASQALALANNLKTQLDTIVIEGDSSVEAAQARVDAEGRVFGTLKERLDTKEQLFTSQIEILNYRADFISVKEFGAKGDGTTDDTVAIQEAISYAVNNGLKGIFFPSGTYKLTEGLIFDNSLQIFGVRASTKLDFTSLSSGICITIGDNNTISDFVLSGIQIIGNNNVIGILLNKNSDINKPIVDSAFRDLRIYNCGVGMQAAFSWCNLFENIRFQNCATSVVLNNQFNHALFSRVSFVTTDYCARLTNAEGIQFESCEFTNVNQIGIILYQSHATIINPYVENCQVFAYVGAPSETFPSSLLVNGGIYTGDIIIARHNSKISVQGARFRSGGTGNLVVKQYDTNSPTIFIKEFSFENNITGDDSAYALIEWFGNTPIPFLPAFGGDTVSSVLHRDGYSIVTASNGINIANGALVPGEQYVLAYAIRSNAAFGTRHVLSLPFNGVQNLSEPFEIRYMPFIAETTDLRLHWTGVAEIAYLALFKGFPTSKPNLREKRVLYASAPPTTGEWKIGDIIYNSIPNAGGNIGWVCVADGIPGTWKTFGTIQS